MAAVTAAGAACSPGGGDLGMAPDAGTPEGRYLDIVGAPGEEVGLAYNSRATLSVRYLREGGGAVRREPVRFALEADRPGETTAGATLSATTVSTDLRGEARVELFSGAQEARFRVSVDARDAGTVYFFVSVAEGGFARVDVEPVHQGWRAGEALTRVEVRLYASAFVSCEALDIDAPPTSAYPPRGLDGFGGAVSFQNVSTRQPHTVVAWAEVADGARPVAVGCLPLDGAQIPTGSVRTAVVVRDRDLILPEVLPVSASFDLGAVAAAVDAAGATAAWDVLGCPAGPGQLLLDCALDAAVPDDALDCVVHGTGGPDDLIAAIEAQRGLLEAGCRPASLEGSGAPALDGRLTEAVAPAWPTGAALLDVLAAQDSAVGKLSLDSALTPLSPGALAHGLGEAQVPAGDQVFSLDLPATSRPVLTASPVAASLDGNLLAVAPHGFTLRYAALAAGAFAALGLGPAGINGDPRGLGQSLVAAVRDPDTDATGCAGLSNLVCTAAGLDADCLAGACSDAVPALDAALAAWLDVLDGSAAGVDFELAGTLALLDADGDLVVEGATPASGPTVEQDPWRARMTLAGGQVVEVPIAP
ncbi:MAG TPA: hypothetical protein VNM90_16055 [Haliangium sp.]|nr:hypothetical protein [Haliangium sp.]